MAMPSGRKQFLSWIAAALIATAALVAVLVWEHRATTGRRAAYIIGDAEKGAALFFGEKQCATCHAIGGSGGHVAPDLSGKRPGTPPMGWLAAVLWNHAPGMWRQMRHGKTSYPHLNSEEMADILAFLYQAGNALGDGDPQAGRRVFNAKSCMRCHSVRSEGGKIGPELSTVAAGDGSTAWARAMWNHSQSMIEPVTRAVGEWPQFRGSEMNDLIAYVRGGPVPANVRRREMRGSAERGWRVFEAKCMACHSVRGQGGTLAAGLGPENDLPLNAPEFASVLWNHAPMMLQQVREKGLRAPVLQGDEINDVVAFIASLRYFEPAGSPYVGQRVFTARGCSRCHGSTAEGTQLGPALRTGVEAFTTVSFATALWKHSPQMIDRAEETGVAWPALQATDIGDLVSFLNGSARQR